MRYHDFSIEIRPNPKPQGGCETYVRSSSQGCANEPLQIPRAALPLRTLVETLERQVRATRLLSQVARELSMDGEGEVGSGAGKGEGKAAEVLGEALFTALFHGETARVLNASLGQVEHSGAHGPEHGDEEWGLRLRFVFFPKDADFTKLAVVPWELLRRSAPPEYLAQFRKTPVVRSLEVPGPVRTVRVKGDLQVLLAEAAPKNLRHLETTLEASRVQAEIEGVSRVRVDHLERADLGRVYKEVVWGGYHVLHFMGHGTFDPDTGEAALWLEGPGRRGVRVPAALFADHLRQSPTLRLVLLNACDTASLGLEQDQNPFAAAAAALAMAGVPAVVAMQFPISDPAAIAFATSFYTAIAHGDPIDAAVVSGRLGIRALEPESRPTLEWVTPVLYLRGDDGQLLEIDPEAPAEEEPADATRRTAQPKREVEPPLRLGIRSLEGFGLDLEPEADRVLSLVRHFNGRHIQDESLWHGAVLPEIQEFLAEGVAAHRPLVLDLAAHQSLAFAIGSFLEPKSSVEISLIQRTPRGTFSWPARPGEVPEGRLWKKPESVPRISDTNDLAVAVSVTWNTLDHVRVYLDRSALPVTRILHAQIEPAPSHDSVDDGPHALRLAQALSRMIRERPISEQMGTLHFFASVPNGLMVFLGQLAIGLGHVQLYEFDYEKRVPGAYWPSFRLPPA